MSTISEQYRSQQKELHQNKKYGAASLSFAPLVIDIMERTGFRSISDYGAGKCRLRVALSQKISKFDYYPFDPAFPEYGAPQSSELVTCIDVLEHIEPDYLDTVIKELASITKEVGFISIHTGPAKKFLSDGRNAHLIQQPAYWWLEKLIPSFDVIQITPVKRGFWVLVQRKGANYSKLFVQKPDYASLGGKLKRWIRRLFKPL